MIISQNSPLLFAPIITPVIQVVEDVPSVEGQMTHRQLKFATYTGVESHSDYFLAGGNLDGLVVSEENIEGGIDMTDFPVVKRGAGVNNYVQAVFSNGRGKSDRITFDFRDYEGADRVNFTANDIVAGGYAEYSYARVAAIFDNLSGPAMFDGSKNRAFPSVIPHEFLTGHVFSGGWGAAEGKRFMAISPVHVVGCNHYHYTVGETLYWKDANNNIVSRQIIGAWYAPEHIDGGQWVDFSAYLLSSPLPASIKPFPLLGDWYYNYQPGSTDSSFIYCPQGFGITLFNNDGHICPLTPIMSSDDSFSGSPLIFDGITAYPIDYARGGGLSSAGYADKPWNVGVGPFAHNIRGGDSGSPRLVPVADGEWAVEGIVSGVLYSHRLIAGILEWLDNSVLGHSSGYAPVVAPDPTL